MTKTEIAKKLQALFEQTTSGPWALRELPDGKDFFIEAPEPSERKFGYAIEILGEDDNGYPTRRADAEFIVACHSLLPELLKAILPKTCNRCGADQSLNPWPRCCGGL